MRDSFLAADGQDLEAAGNLSNGGLFYGLHLLPLEEVIREWLFWRQAEHDPLAGTNPAVLATMASVPPGWIKCLYACRGWIPLLSDRTGNYVGVDLDPGPGGSWGQVIVFGRDFDRKCVLWRGEGEGGWGKWFAAFVDELESGEGWEADKSNSSDEDEEVGYGTYNGGGSYGEAGKGLRLAGEYRGWNVLEAWWDRSVRKWEEMGLGLDVEAVEKGLQEARRLAGYDEKGKGKEMAVGIGMRSGESAAQVEIPGEWTNMFPALCRYSRLICSVLGSPQMPPAPGTPTPHDSDVLLPPASPDQMPLPAIPRIHQPAPVRTITPITSSSDHPLAPGRTSRSSSTSHDGYLSPPSRSPPRQGQAPRRSAAIAPAVTPLDLPTRADMQAMSAIAQAEASGLRGGWIMSLDTTPAARLRRNDEDMEDIDLEGGKVEKFGSPRMSDVEMDRQREDERLAMAGMEHRRPSPLTSRSSSPLARETSLEVGDMTQTPKATAYRDEPVGVPPSVIAATTALRRPPPVANHNQQTIRTRTADEERDKEVIRGDRRETPPRTQRESSVISIGSEQGLLDGRNSERGTPVLGSPVQSPMTLHSEGVPEVRVNGAELNGVEDAMEEISLGAG